MRRVVGVAAAVAAAAGCGGSPTGAAPPADVARMAEVADLVRLYAEQKGKPPAAAAELRVYENAYPVGYEAVRTGEVVVSWGGRPDGSDAVLAYQKAVPSAGGLVALANGEVKSMTADEFKAARRAGK